MKKRISFLGALLAALLCFALYGCSGNTAADPYDSDKMPDDSYRMTQLNVTADASAGDRSIRITEEYTFTFDTYSHGFYRDIAINSGEKIRNVDVSDAAAFSDEYKIEHTGSVLRIRVGSEDREVRGSNLKCTIAYTMLTPEHVSSPDVLALNVIGQGWSCAIENAEITVKLPAAAHTAPRYYYGEWGESKDPVQGGKINAYPESGLTAYTFSVRDLDAYEGFTVYYDLPQGALKTRAEAGTWIIPLVAALLVAVAFLLKFLFGKHPPIAPITHYYPPKHPGAGEHDLPMDPVDMGYLIDHTCQGSDVTSLIFYFASKGYLEIVEPDEDDKSENFTLKKVCDLPKGLPKYQYTLFDRIFSRSKTVTVKSLTNRTYSAVQSAQSQIAAKYNGKLYSGKATGIGIGVIAATAVFAFFTVFFGMWRVDTSYIWPVGFVALFPLVFPMLIGTYLVRNWLRIGWFKRIGLLTAMALVASVLSLLVVLVTPWDVFYVWERAALTVCVAVNAFIAPFIARRTDYYTEELNAVLGFNDFLQTAEKERLEMLLEENPQYYYDILPYANVLGVSSIWQDKFEGLTLEPPSYYRGVSVFDIILFNRLYRHSYHAYSAAAVSRPSSSSRSGGGRSGGGGGFSGGGFGGGGGGRW